MDHVVANDRILVQSVSNSVGDDSSVNQFTTDFLGTDMANKPWLLLGLRLNPDLTPPSLNGKTGIDATGIPGTLVDRTLAVVAQGIAVEQIGGGTKIEAGNSFAAPAIAGAAALLKQYWPQLGGKAIASILLSSADDLGAPGPDQIYGVGLLDVAKAMQAQNPTIGLSSIASSPVAGSSITFGAAFGGSDGALTWSKAAGTTVVLDKFGRDYRFNVGALAHAGVSGGVSVYGATMPQQSLRLASAMNQSAAIGFAATNPGQSDPAEGRTRTGAFAFQTGPHTVVSGHVGGGVEDSALATGSLLRSAGLATDGSAVSIASFGYQLSFGTAATPHNDASHTSSTVQRMMVQMPSGFRLGLTAAREQGSALGLAGTGAFAIAGATSTFATVGWAANIAGFGLVADAMVGRTSVRTSSEMIGFAAPILSTGFRVQADHAAFGGTATFGITSPVRVQSATLRYTAPVAYDLASGSVVNRTTDIDLAPKAREMNLEGGWSKALSGSASFAAGAAYSLNSGNLPGRTSAGLWLRVSKAF